MYHIKVRVYSQRRHDLIERMDEPATGKGAVTQREIARDAVMEGVADGIFPTSYSLAGMAEKAPDGWLAWSVTDGFAHNVGTVYTKPCDT